MRGDGGEENTFILHRVLKRRLREDLFCKLRTALIEENELLAFETEFLSLPVCACTGIGVLYVINIRPFHIPEKMTAQIAAPAVII
jgi:hypothetical protein